MREDTPLSGLVVGGLGRVLSDGVLLYLSYKRILWAKVLLIFLWVVVIGSCILAMTGILGGSTTSQAKLGLTISGATYALLSLALGLGDRWENKKLHGIAGGNP